MIKQQIDADIKTAMLAGEKQLVQTLRSLKSAILNVEVANGSREQGLSDAEAIEVLTKEAKKRLESADMYKQGGDEARHQAEMVEKAIIEKYLPAQLTDEELQAIVDEEVAQLPERTPQSMGKVIGAVKSKTAGKADGGRIAALVKEALIS
jgi:uncharacterized protein YqeY